MRQKNGITYQLNPFPVRTNFTSPFEPTRITGLSTINRKINNCTQWQIPLHGLPQQSSQKPLIARTPIVTDETEKESDRKPAGRLK